MSSWHVFIFVLIILGNTFIAISYLWEHPTSSRKRKKNVKAGTIIINTTDPKKDVIRIELDVSVGELMAMKEATFQIENEDS